MRDCGRRHKNRPEWCLRISHFLLSLLNSAFRFWKVLERKPRSQRETHRVKPMYYELRFDAQKLKHVSTNKWICRDLSPDYECINSMGWRLFVLFVDETYCVLDNTQLLCYSCAKITPFQVRAFFCHRMYWSSFFFPSLCSLSFLGLSIPKLRWSSLNIKLWTKF